VQVSAFIDAHPNFGVEPACRALGARPRNTSGAGPPADLVDRNFQATRPNQLWATDSTYVPTWSGMVHIAFVVNMFSRRIVGWRAVKSMTTELVLNALKRGCAAEQITRKRPMTQVADRPSERIHD